MCGIRWALPPDHPHGNAPASRTCGVSTLRNSKGWKGGTLATETQATIDRLSAGTFEVPLLPQVANQVMAICADPDCEIRDLTETIKNDQALMAHVLRMANSALYAADVPIVSLQLAVNRLGLSTVRDLAVAAACKGAVFRPGRSKKLVHRLFKRAMARGVFSQEIARIRRSNVEVAFLAGLMREIGSPVIVFELTKADIEDAEILDVIEAYRFQVSATVLENWGFPSKICESVKFAGQPDNAGKLSDLVHTAALADLLAHRALAPEEVQASSILDDACVALNLYADDISKLDAKSEQIVALVEALG